MQIKKLVIIIPVVIATLCSAGENRKRTNNHISDSEITKIALPIKKRKLLDTAPEKPSATNSLKNKSDDIILSRKLYHTKKTSKIQRPNHIPKEKCLSLNKKKDHFFIPNEFRPGHYILTLPSTDTIYALDHFQQTNLTIKKSKISLKNNGVFLKDDCSGLFARQVIGIYHGHQMRMYRPHNFLKTNSASFLNPHAPWSASLAKPNGFECFTRQWQSVVTQDHIYYRIGGNEITLKTDVLDSPSIITHAQSCNKSAHTGNIVLLPCFDPAWVIRAELHGAIEVNAEIPFDAYQLIFIAATEISPGQELVWSNITIKKTSSSKLMAKDIIFAHKAKAPTKPDITEWEKGASMSLFESKGAELSELKKEIIILFKLRYNIENAAEWLTGQYHNPLSGNTRWLSGELIYFCQREGIAYPKSPKEPTYLVHCKNKHGELDNIGKSYLADLIYENIVAGTHYWWTDLYYGYIPVPAEFDQWCTGAILSLPINFNSIDTQTLTRSYKITKNCGYQRCSFNMHLLVLSGRLDVFSFIIHQGVREKLLTGILSSLNNAFRCASLTEEQSILLQQSGIPQFPLDEKEIFAQSTTSPQVGGYEAIPLTSSPQAAENMTQKDLKKQKKKHLH